MDANALWSLFRSMSSLRRLNSSHFLCSIYFCVIQFGGKLISYNVVVAQTPTQPPVHYTQHTLAIHQVVADPELISRAEKLENTLSNGNFLDYCLYKIAEHSDNENISKAWKLVALHLEGDERKQKENLLELLGFGLSTANGIDQLCHSTHRLNTQQISPINDSVGGICDSNLVNELPESPMALPILPESMRIKIDTNDQTLGNEINRAILGGDVYSVISKCIERSNWSEAILLCCFVAPEYTASTLRQYFNHCVTSNTNSWSALLWCIVSAQTTTEGEMTAIFNDFVSKVDLEYWKELLAFISRESDNWEDVNTKPALIDNLAKRLIQQYVETGAKQWLDAGIYCYIVNGDYFNVAKFVPFGSHLDRIELSLVLQKCTNAEFVVNQLTAHYAKLLAIEGKLDLALKYIDDNESELKDRIIGSLRPDNRFMARSQPTGIRAQTNVHNFNKSYASRVQTPAPVNTVSQMPTTMPANYSMPPSYSNPYGTTPMATTMANYPPPPPTMSAAIPNAPVVRPSAPMAAQYPSIGSIYTPSQHNSVYNQYPGTQAYGEQAYTPQVVSPGWNDPPVLNRARHNSLSEGQSAYHPIANTISTPLPVVPTEAVEPMARPMRPESRRQSFGSHSMPEPLSPQNQQICDAFNRLVSQLEQSPNSQAMNVKRKLEDSRHKLETMRSKLGPSGQLSANTVSGLSQIADAINRNDFQRALDCHSHLVATTTFGETTAFLPAIKVILHLAQQRIQ